MTVKEGVIFRFLVFTGSEAFCRSYSHNDHHSLLKSIFNSALCYTNWKQYSETINGTQFGLF